MWRVEYIGENTFEYGRTGWANEHENPDRLWIRFDGEFIWRDCPREEYEAIEY